MGLTNSDFESWIGSVERQEAIRKAILWLVGAVVLGGFAALALTSRELIRQYSVRFVVAIALASIASICYAMALSTLQGSRARFQQAQARKLDAEQEQALEQLEDVTELATLLKVNRQQMVAYQSLSREQAASSYLVSQIASIVGGVILLAGAAVVLAVPSSASKVSVAALSALGGLVAAYIGRTFLRVYERTLIQLNFYFQQPLLASYFLSAERLAEKVGGKQRDETYARVVDGILSVTARTVSGSARSDIPAAAPTLASPPQAPGVTKPKRRPWPWRRKTKSQ